MANILKLYEIATSKNRAKHTRQGFLDQLSEIADIEPEQLDALLELPIKVAAEELPRLEDEVRWGRCTNPGLNYLIAKYGRMRIDPSNDIWYFEKKPVFFRNYDQYKEVPCHRNRTIPDPFIGIGLEGETMGDEEAYKTGMAAVLGEAFAEGIMGKYREGGVRINLLGEPTSRAFMRMLGLPVPGMPTTDKELRKFYALHDLYRMHVRLSGGDERIDEAAKNAAESLKNEDPWGVKGTFTRRGLKKVFTAMDAETRSWFNALVMSLEGHIVKAIQHETGCSIEGALDKFFGPVVVKMLYAKDMDVGEFLESAEFTDYLRDMA